MTISVAGFRLRQRGPTPARELGDWLPEHLVRLKAAGEALIAEGFKGISADGAIVPGLFPIKSTGIPTQPIKEAAEAFLASLSSEQQATACFPVDSDVWQRWCNVHPFLMRHGVPLDVLSPAQRERALALLEESLSAAGFQTARDVMRLNHHIGEITGKWSEYGEWLYWVSMMGKPSSDAPWGWQIDGHHLIVNCFVLGDQIVLTPMFMGSEPVTAESGKYAGTSVFRAEEGKGLALMRSLTGEQRRQATLSDKLPRELFTAAFRDNFELRYEGLRFDAISSAQQSQLVDLVQLYVGRMRPGHAAVKMEEVKAHLAETHFAWMGGCEEDSIFYYRIHSPVLLVEFDHQAGIAFDNDEPTRNHIHTVVRTPNGNDYGKDLLRQHHERFEHAHPAAKTAPGRSA